MSEPFVGQIMPVGFSFAPRGWALCDGQLLPISQNDALFSLLGTTYGGDGRTTFALPDLRGRVAVHAGHGPGLADRPLGQRGGAEQVALVATQMPSHTHTITSTVRVVDDTGNQRDPGGAYLARANDGESNYTDAKDTTGTLAGVGSTAETTGGSQPHENMPPYLVVNWCIALVGVYPSRP